MQVWAIGGSQKTDEQEQNVIRAIMSCSVDVGAVAKHFVHPLKRHAGFHASTIRAERSRDIDTRDRIEAGSIMIKISLNKKIHSLHS
jgi:hypothetical protein